MKIFIVLSCALTLASADTSRWSKKKMVVTFGLLGKSSQMLGTAYHDVSRFYDQAQKDGWLPIKNTNEFKLDSLAYRGKDFRIVPLYKDGVLVGIQTSMAKDKMDETQPPNTNLLELDVYFVQTVGDTEVYSGTAYFFNPETIAKSDPIVSDVLGTGLWIKNGTGFTQVPATKAEFESSVYTKQACLPMMGNHWYYKMDENTDCDKFRPYFPLEMCGNLNGVGYQLFGKGGTETNGRNWYDDINALKAKITVPNSPKCLETYTTKYGVTSVHYYFTDKPYNINCLTCLIKNY